MKQKRQGVGAAVLNGKIYAVGGLCGKEYLNVVERYSPQTNSWEVLPSMAFHRAFLGVVACNGSLFVIGGETFESKKLNSQD